MSKSSVQLTDNEPYSTCCKNLDVNHINTILKHQCQSSFWRLALFEVLPLSCSFFKHLNLQYCNRFNSQLILGLGSGLSSDQKNVPRKTVVKAGQTKLNVPNKAKWNTSTPCSLPGAHLQNYTELLLMVLFKRLPGASLTSIDSQACSWFLFCVMYLIFLFVFGETLLLD